VNRRRSWWKWAFGLGIPLLALSAYLISEDGAKEAGPDGAEQELARGKTTGPSGWGTEPDAARLELAAVAGKVVDLSNQGVPSASVWAADDQARLYEASSGPGGEFEVRDLPPGEYRIAARLDAQSCEPVGPLPLAPGDEVRGIVLKLVPGARLSGRVLDLRTQQPLPGAQVAIAATPLVATADVHGHFDLSAVLPGGHQLRVTAARHVARTVPMSFGQGARVSGLDIFLQPAATVKGRVARADGTGIAGASLFLARYHAAGSDDGQALLLPLPAQSDANGQFSLELEAGAARLIARSRGLAEGQSDMLDLVEGQESKVDIVLRAGGQVVGAVHGADGHAVSSGQIAVFSGTDRDHGWKAGEAPIGRDGHFEVDALPKGHLLVSADAEQAHASGSVDLEEGGTAQLELKLGNGTLRGTVNDGHGSPVSGARVVARAVGSGEAGELSAVSDDAGRFRLTGLSGDRFDLSASKDESTAQLRGVSSGRDDLVLVLATGAISGFVVTPDGASVTDFYLAVEPDLPGKGGARSSHVVDVRGEFRLPVAPGSYLVRATAPGYAEGQIPVPVKVADGEESGGVRVELRPSGSITGIVLDADNGVPLVGVHLATDLGHVWAVGRSEPLGGSVAVSAIDGHFVLQGVPPGNWPVRAQSLTHEAIGPPPFVTVVAGQSPPDVQIRLRRSEGHDQLYAGVGMSLFEHDGHKYAGEVFEGGPAKAAGVRQGDLIVAIDGQAADGLSLGDLVGLIRGPSGSEVTLDMQRGQGQSYSVVVPRAEIRF
jgi:hypothetical protein